MARQVIDDGPTIPEPDPRPPTPAVTNIPGPVGARWHQLGGLSWGKPMHPLGSKDDGRGQFAVFRLHSNAVRTIVWTAATGARVIGGEINGKWGQLGGHRSLLGYPTSDEFVTHDGVGRYQSFEGGLIVWHQQTGAHEVHGDILTRYGQLGGSAYGYPSTDESATPDGRGRFSHFLEMPGHEKSIYWTPQTGAHEVYGMIRARWAALGWERGSLGYPTSGELVTHDRGGRYQSFEGGIIVWHPALGAHVVQGDILTRYGQLGGSAYGYPSTDETATPDGRGRFNHFVEMPGQHEKSIYWTPQTGAHEVYGLIRGRWAALGGERGHLGYPTSGEEPWAGEAGGRRQSFQNGQVLYSGTHNVAYPDPMRWVHRIDAGGFKGQVEASADSAGWVRFGGYVRSSALVGFDYVVQAMVRSDTDMAVAMTSKGSVSGTHGSDEKDALSHAVHNQLVQDNYRSFALGSLEVQHKHDNKLLDTLGDITEGLLKWTAGSLAITPGTGLVLVAATEIVSLATSGSLLPGARILSGTLWLAGPTGTLFAMAADGLVRLASKAEPISKADYDFADLVFKGTLPPREDILMSNGLGGGGRRFTYPRFDGKIVLNFGDDWQNPRAVTSSKYPKAGQLLIHELVHAWQYHNNTAAVSYVGDAIWARVREGFTGKFETYDPGVEFTEAWDDFGLEEQARIVDMWFGTHYDPALTSQESGLASPKALQDDRFAYIRDSVRTGRN